MSLSKMLKTMEGRLAAIEKTLERIEQEQKDGYRQIEAAVALSAAVNLTIPLPPMRGTFALCPDAAVYVIRKVLGHRPKAVVELGSGTSTVLLAKSIEHLGESRLRSVEHDAGWAEATWRYVQANGLDFVVDFVVAPLRELELDGETWLWYGQECFDGVDTIDFLLIDGPPDGTGPLARYPALPMAADRLTRGALIFLDDAIREDELVIAERWTRELPVKVLEAPGLERGGILLEWQV